VFNIFKKKLSLNEYAKSAEILPVAEEGDFKAFIIQVQDTGANFSSTLKSGGKDAVSTFVEIIDRRISDGDFENIFSMVDQMADEYGMSKETRNLNAERIVVCNGESSYIFKWIGED
jgi:hypothetical protein